MWVHFRYSLSLCRHLLWSMSRHLAPVVTHRSCLRAAPPNEQLGRRDFHPLIHGLFRHTIRIPLELDVREDPSPPMVERVVQEQVGQARCQRTTVSGLTTTSASVQRDQRWESTTQKARSLLRRRGRAEVRRKLASC